MPADTPTKFATAVADHAYPIMSMFNGLGETQDDDLQAATETMVYLQCWAHVQRAVGLLTC